MADKGNDPLAVWQTMLGEMEKNFNAFANQAMTSPEFSRAMNQAGGAGAGAQKQFAEFMAKYLAGMNLPSREQMVDIGARLQSIEAQLGEIRTMLQQSQAGAGGPATARPPRTKQPPKPAGEPT